MKQYLELLSKIVSEGEDVQSGAVIQSENRKAVCRFLLAQQLRFDLREGFPAVTTKRLLFDWVVDEILWFLRGETDTGTLGRQSGSSFLRRPIWDRWADSSGDVKHIYGEMWRNWPYHGYGGGYEYWDQIASVLADLKAVRADPANRARRRIILTGWNPPVVPHMGLAPCHTLAQFLPTNGYLDTVCHWRSIDTFTGMPFNIAQYALLTHILAHLAGLRPRHLVCNIADCHVYDNQYEQIAEQVSRTPHELPLLVIDRQFFDTAPELSPEQLERVDHDWFRLDGYQYDRRQLKAEVAV